MRIERRKGEIINHGEGFRYAHKGTFEEARQYVLDNFNFDALPLDHSFARKCLDEAIPKQVTADSSPGSARCGFHCFLKRTAKPNESPAGYMIVDYAAFTVFASTAEEAADAFDKKSVAEYAVAHNSEWDWNDGDVASSVARLRDHIIKVFQRISGGGNPLGRTEGGIAAYKGTPLRLEFVPCGVFVEWPTNSGRFGGTEGC